MDARKIAEEIIALDEKIADLRERFERVAEPERAAALDQVLDETRRATGEDDLLPLAMLRAADLAVGLETRGAALLAAGLEHPNPDVRELSGQALLNLAEDDVGRLRPAADRALERGGAAAEEMVFVLAGVDDEEAPREIERFLAHAEADVVATAVEALAEVGDEQTITALEDLVDDQREVGIDGEEDEERETCRIGDLAREAIEMIEKELDEED